MRSPAAAQRTRGAGGDRGLADAALARVEDRARPHDRASLGGLRATGARANIPAMLDSLGAETREGSVDASPQNSIQGPRHGRRSRASASRPAAARAVARPIRTRCSARPSAARTRSTAGISTLTLTIDSVRLEHAQRPDHAQLRRPVPEPRHRQAAGVELQRQRRARSASSGSRRHPLDRHRRLRDASGAQLPAAAGDVPEARVELLLARIDPGRRARAPARSASSASSRCTG